MESGQIERRERHERRIPSERRDTIDELSEQLFVVQKIGQWLANETHGDRFAEVRALNELFHQAQSQLRRIRKGDVESDDRPLLRRRPDH